jgi:eukaryotic-like serine/threonine-protein kinase
MLGMSAIAATQGLDANRASDEVEPATVRSTGLRGPGSVLAGKYRLELLLGEGGMGFVWSAYHLELELPVAIKLLRAGPRNERLAERLRLEARAAARLVHPSIVRVLDISATESGDPFIVMELLSGESLAQVLSRERLSGVRAVQLLLPIAEGLALAHAKGIVHRDLKPDNVFLSTDEQQQFQPKLLDFGIAKLEHATTQVSKLTEKGTVLGSPTYMSPEQVGGDDIDYRTDIWSFCVVLYKAVTGRAPFAGIDKRVVMDAIMNDEPAPIAADSGVDAQLARLILWGLTKDPSRRPTSMRELGRQLAEWLLSHGVSDDACGAPLAAKWLAHVAEPSMRRPPAITKRLGYAAPEPAPTLTSPSSSRAHDEQVQVLSAPSIVRHRRVERALATRVRHWALLAALFLLIAGGSIAGAGSAQRSRERSAVATAVAEAPRAPRPEELIAPALTETAPVQPAPPATDPPPNDQPEARALPAAPKRAPKPKRPVSQLPF